MNTLQYGQLDRASRRLTSALRKGILWCKTGWQARWGRRLPGVLATVLAFSLLLAFVQLVLASVQRGESRSRAVAARAEREWRCSIQQFASQRLTCRAQIDVEVLDTIHP